MLAAMESHGTPDAPLPDLPPGKDGSRTKRAKNAPLPETALQSGSLDTLRLLFEMISVFCLLMPIKPTLKQETQLFGIKRRDQVIERPTRRVARIPARDNRSPFNTNHDSRAECRRGEGEL
jgi:hypothetical protein